MADDSAPVINGCSETSLDDAQTEDENAKAKSIAGQLMGNPLVLDAIQNKLASMVGGDSGYIKSLPQSVQRRVKALKKLQFECTKIEAEFYEEIHKLECKFADRYSPIFKKRSEIITGKYEPSEEECDWPSDSEDEDEEAKKPPVKEETEKTHGIESFWSTTFKNADMLAEMIQEHDEPILDSLTDIKVSFKSEPMGFTLNFEFDENDYFTDKVLTKHYDMRSSPDEEDPFGFEGPEIVSCKGCTIHWKEGKNVTVSSMKKKQKNAKTGVTRMVTKTVQLESFFNFFSPPDVPEGDSEEGLDEDTEALLQADYRIGYFIREKVVPYAVLYFTGEACEDDDEDEDDEEDNEEEYDEDDDPDYDPNSEPVQAKDCKQQ
ncbi:nucleosome assembly protein 1-like 1 isoform X2 [Watersipora subatra]|uniref:nucleosome assembly protein 1-like 1 isoform X2 n=1 Tax=Watersipora subatra TaxID=2589382 RepID=UPI00355C07BB